MRAIKQGMSEDVYQDIALKKGQQPIFIAIESYYLAINSQLF
ncbi:MAG: hypothetical protein P8J42_07685 [Pseudomonadales bacterium]|nr:hypothetical protein [Pseudomonadales bacterium]MDG2036473.1 hypothetical protein [Pseudomonadales bacterium]